MKTWFANHGRNPSTKPKFKNPRKVSLLQVINRDYKAEVTALASQMADGAVSGSQAHFAKYATALAAFKDSMSEEQLAAAEEERKIWDVKGLPDDIKIKNGMKYSKAVVFAAAESQFRDLGLRSHMWEWHKDEDGNYLYHL